jgi:hypothetical protein
VTVKTASGIKKARKKTPMGKWLNGISVNTTKTSSSISRIAKTRKMVDGIVTTVVMCIVAYMDGVVYTLMGILNILMEQSNGKKKRRIDWEW